MFLYPLLALLTPFPRPFIIQGNYNNGRNPSSCPLPLLAFMNDEATGCINEAAIGAIIDLRNPPLLFFNLVSYCFSHTIS